jgi:hypothetical protein
MAFSGKQLSMLHEEIEKMRDRRAAFEEVPVTVDDIQDKFINPEDQEIMQRAAELIDSRYMDRTINAALFTTTFSTLRVTFRLASHKIDGKPMFLVPTYANSGFTREPISFGLPFEQWINACINNRIDFNYVRKTLDIVDSICQVGSHVAFHWPVIRILAQATGDGKLIESLDQKSRAPIPPMPPELRAACKQTAEIVTMAHLLGKPPERKYGFTIYVAALPINSRETPIGIIRDGN